jgi:hypothetical protein
VRYKNVTSKLMSSYVQQATIILKNAVAKWGNSASSSLSRWRCIHTVKMTDYTSHLSLNFYENVSLPCEIYFITRFFKYTIQTVCKSNL